MLSQVLVVFPHVESPIFKYMLTMTCLLTLISFAIAQRSQPGHLRRIEHSNLLQLLKKVEPERVCPTCELVQSNGAFHCTACRRCVVNFENHSLLVNNCVSNNNRKYLIAFLLSLLAFFCTLILIAVFHFEKPSLAFDADAQQAIDVLVGRDVDGPF